MFMKNGCKLLLFGNEKQAAETSTKEKWTMMIEINDDDDNDNDCDDDGHDDGNNNLIIIMIIAFIQTW